MKHLEQVKWREGYNCRRCSYQEYVKGKQFGCRRCCNCQYDESATSHTLFHKVKFGIDKAFEMLYEIVASKKGANSIWLAEHFGVNQKTPGYFGKKYWRPWKAAASTLWKVTCMWMSLIEIGTPQKGEQGRS